MLLKKALQRIEDKEKDNKMPRLEIGKLKQVFCSLYFQANFNDLDDIRILSRSKVFGKEKIDYHQKLLKK